LKPCASWKAGRWKRGRKGLKGRRGGAGSREAGKEEEEEGGLARRYRAREGKRRRRCSRCSNSSRWTGVCRFWDGHLLFSTRHGREGGREGEKKNTHTNTHTYTYIYIYTYINITYVHTHIHQQQRRGNEPTFLHHAYSLRSLVERYATIHPSFPSFLLSPFSPALPPSFSYLPFDPSLQITRLFTLPPSLPPSLPPCLQALRLWITMMSLPALFLEMEGGAEDMEQEGEEEGATPPSFSLPI